MAKRLWKTTIEIWTDEDSSDWELETLAQEATSGTAFCTVQKCETITDTKKFPDVEFFDLDD